MAALIYCPYFDKLIDNILANILSYPLAQTFNICRGMVNILCSTLGIFEHSYLLDRAEFFEVPEQDRARENKVWSPRNKLRDVLP